MTDVLPELKHSTPNVEEFNPGIIPYQREVIKTVREWDYKTGVLEILLSGSLGSAKSIVMAHLACTHVMMHEGARFLIGRKTLPDLKVTLAQKIIEHLNGVLTEGEDYSYNQTSCKFEFYNGSQILSRTWGDKNFAKFRSLDLSGAAIEEVTENSDDDFSFYRELRARIGRLVHVPERFIIGATNPGSPSSKIYKHFMLQDVPFIKVFYSNTLDNPFLPPWYIEQLKSTFTGREAERMLFGKWLELKTEVVYYAYSESLSVIDGYLIDRSYPIALTFDFNIGLGKPMSAAAFQYREGVFYFFKEFIIEGANTEQIMEEVLESGIFDHNCDIIIHGDANGRAKSTKSGETDYEIMNRMLRNARNNQGLPIHYTIDVPTINPSVRERHIIVNGRLKNALGKTSVKITKDCETIREGLRLTTLKKGSGYIEDDSKHYQHVTTAIGYGIIRQLEREKMGQKYRGVRF